MRSLAVDCSLPLQAMRLQEYGFELRSCVPDELPVDSGSFVGNTSDHRGIQTVSRIFCANARSSQLRRLPLEALAERPCPTVTFY
jgi:hypothetical protein